MAKEEITPSEWQIMEVLWACGEPLTSSEVYKRMQGNVDMSMRMVRVLLKTLKLLRSGTEGTQPAVTYAGEKEFEDMKRRMGEIAGFRPYQKKMCVGMAAIASLIIVVMLLAVHTHSYARCNESKDIMVGNYDGEPGIVSYDTEKLREISTPATLQLYKKPSVFTIKFKFLL